MNATTDTATEIRSFSVEISQEQIDNLRRLTQAFANAILEVDGAV